MVNLNWNEVVNIAGISTERSAPEQIELIHSTYQKLREKENEIRNNLKLMDIKLSQIVMPIKNVR